MISATGTGTQSDPYIVDNTDDFVEAIAKPEAYVKLKNDINFNVGNYYDITSPINIKCRELDGCGYKLDNILSTLCCNLFMHYNSTEGTNNNLDTNTIKNLCIEIFVLPYTSNAISNTYLFLQNSNKYNNLLFLNCDFRIKGNGNNSTSFIIFGTKGYSSSNASRISCRNCIFNIEMNNFSNCTCFTNSNGGGWNNGTYFYKCMINLKYNSTGGDIFGNWSNLVEDCGIYIHNNSSGYKLYIRSGNSNHSCHMYNSYIIYKSDNNSKIYLSSSTDMPTFVSKCFYDKDISNGLIYDRTWNSTDVELTSHNNLLALTTEQCKDAAYLASMGFGIST